MDGSEILRLKYTEDIYLNTQILREYAHLRVRVRGVAGRGGAGRAGPGWAGVHVNASGKRDSSKVQGW